MKKSSCNLQGLANMVCARDMDELSSRINDFFYSVSMDMSILVPDDAFHMSADCTVPARFTITLEQVQKQLEFINTRKAVSPDSIPSWVLLKEVH